MSNSAKKVDATSPEPKPLSVSTKRSRVFRKVLNIILVSLGITVVVYFGIALTLVFSDAPAQQRPAAGSGINFNGAMNADYASLPETLHYEARDGSSLPYRMYEGGTERLIVLAHGSGWHGMQFHPMAQALAEAEIGTVVVPDLRGHGAEPERRGDLDYIGQFEDDIVDLIETMDAPSGSDPTYREVVLGGHSSGGGLVVRFAGGDQTDLVDRYILMAPFLKYNAPTTKPNSGDWAYPATRRIIGLTMLNNVGITALNHLPVISFAMPADVLDGPLGSTATTEYSFRLNTAFAPSNYERDLAALDRPFLLLAGDADESFITEQYEPVISAQTSFGAYEILDGVSHIGVTTEPAAIDAIAEWLQAAQQ